MTHLNWDQRKDPCELQGSDVLLKGKKTAPTESSAVSTLTLMLELENVRVLMMITSSTESASDTLQRLHLHM